LLSFFVGLHRIFEDTYERFSQQKQ
jgi:hypothetical protein